MQSGGFLSRLLGPLLKTGLPLMKNVIKPLASVLIPLGLTAAASVADAGIHKRILGSGRCHFSSSALRNRPSSSTLHNDNNTVLIISNDELKDIIKVKSLENSSLSAEGVSETIQNEPKEERGGFLSMLLGMLGEGFLGNILAGRETNRAGEGVVRACYESKKGQKIQGQKKKMDF